MLVFLDNKFGNERKTKWEKVTNVDRIFLIVNDDMYMSRHIYKFVKETGNSQKSTGISDKIKQ